VLIFNPIAAKIIKKSEMIFTPSALLSKYGSPKIEITAMPTPDQTA
jgi:hypothetical protein